MAQFLKAKAPADAIAYTWAPNIADGDSLATFTLSATGATIDTEAAIADKVEFYVSGGTAGQTATITASAVTAAGAELSDTLYLPIIASASQVADTARDYVYFALRPVTGNAESPDAEELSDGLDRLNHLIAEMRAGGADIGAPYPLTAESVIYCPDWAVSALRYNLRIQVMPDYGAQPTVMDFERARRGMQLVKHKNLPDVRTAEYF